MLILIVTSHFQIVTLWYTDVLLFKRDYSLYRNSGLTLFYSNIIAFYLLFS